MSRKFPPHANGHWPITFSISSRQNRFSESNATCASFLLQQKYALDPWTRKTVNLLVTFLKVLFHLDLTLCLNPVIFRPFSSLYSWSYWEVSNCAIRSKKDYCVLQTRMATFASCEIRSKSDTTWHLSVKVTRGRQYLTAAQAIFFFSLNARPIRVISVQVPKRLFAWTKSTLAKYTFTGEIE